MLHKNHHGQPGGTTTPRLPSYKPRFWSTFFEQYLPKSGVVESDRMLLKEVLMSHSEYRAHSGSQDLCWKARLHKSGIEVFSLVEAGLFSKMLFSVSRTFQLLLF